MYPILLVVLIMITPNFKHPLPTLPKDKDEKKSKIKIKLKGSKLN